ncbi:MAG: hypothetical protein BWY19_00946 [bacterium ADurb.Bin212]|nr:MAG: hypothetical protein BWY19_00946 [bacterium ADurb.Bin212]
MNISKYLEYASSLGANNKVISWIDHNLENHLEKHQEDQTEIEHIIDFLISDKCPVRLDKVSYKQAKEKTDLWVKELNKQAEKIVESDNDTEIVLDFKDGFKFVKLVGKNAFDREGLLMSSCVASYYGRDTNIYSLRDKENKPHCTIEENQQIKGKGNSSIHPKYIKYVVEFLEFLGMEVSDNEMANLGYVNISDVKDKEAVFTDLFRKKYFYKGNKILDKEGKEYHNMTLWDKFNIFDLDLKLNINWNFDIALSIKTFLARVKKDKDVQASSGNGSQLASSGYYSKLASSGYGSKLASSGDCSQLASSGYYSKLASSGNGSQLASSGYCSQLASSGDYSKLASSGNNSKLASSGDYSKLASSGNGSQLASSGYYSQLASSGDYSKLASSGYGSQLASSGNGSQLALSGKQSVGANIGINGIAKGIIGCWITLAEYDNDYKIKYVKSAMIDGKKLKENTWYKLENKKFVEANDN